MFADNFKLEHYLQRIGWEGSLGRDAATLGRLMRHQLLTIPFENLDVQAGKIVSMTPEDIVDKIVGRRRGGYCYEVNGLFAMALAHLGIPFKFIAARPMFYPSRRPKTHMALIAEADGHTWLCDLGFGSYGIRAPMRLDVLDKPVRQDSDVYTLRKTSDKDYLLTACIDGTDAPQYSFDTSEQEWVDFWPANYLNSTHPDAIFVQKLLVILHTPAGRVILLGDMLKTVEGAAISQQKLSDVDIANTLRERFGLATH